MQMFGILSNHMQLQLRRSMAISLLTLHLSGAMKIKFTACILNEEVHVSEHLCTCNMTSFGLVRKVKALTSVVYVQKLSKPVTRTAVREIFLR